MVNRSLVVITIYCCLFCWTGGRTDNIQMDKQKDRETDRQADGCMDGWTDKRQTDGGTDGQTDGMMDRRTDRFEMHSICIKSWRRKISATFVRKKS